MSHSWILLLFILLFGNCLLAQQTDISGKWRGTLSQQTGGQGFIYEIDIEQNGAAVSGQARSRSTDGTLSATFELSGKWDGQLLQLQEFRQLQPAAPKWCLKFMNLTFSVGVSEAQLSGPWTAKGCDPGTLTLTRPVSRVEEVPFEFTGRWVGELSQSDRDYGFYYELNLNPGGRGFSKIVSEDNGGEARMRLNWRRVDSLILITEEGIAEKTDTRWRWCIKEARMVLNRAGNIYRMQGNWSGFLEDYTPQTGACAPGQVFLEKAVLTRTVLDQVAATSTPYEASTKRKVKVDRVIKVKSNNIRIRVWDSGTVDGDIITLFLNGEQVLDRYRVNKRKWTIPVEILNGENLLILHAEDLGDIRPNTVAVAIDDGVREQTIVMSSNLEESGAVLIQPFTF